MTFSPEKCARPATSDSLTSLGTSFGKQVTNIDVPICGPD